MPYRVKTAPLLGGLVMRFLVLLALSFSTLAQARVQYVSLPDGHRVAVNVTAAKGSKPTLLLMNGLVYPMERWDGMTDALTQQGFGVIRYEFRGQIRTLKAEVKDRGTPAFYTTGLSPESLADEAADVLRALKVSRPVTVVGLSYGAGIAAAFADRYPDLTDKLIFLAPLVISLHRYDGNGQWIQMNLDALRLWWGPLWGPYVYDFYYNMIFRSYLSQRIVPERVPEEVKDIPDHYKEAVFHQVRAMRDFDLRTYSFQSLAKNAVHMVIASEEELPAMKDQFRAWNSFAQKGSVVYASPSWHAIPDSIPDLAGSLVGMMAEGRKEFTGGSAWMLPTKSGRLQAVKSAQALEEAALKDRR